VQNEHKDEKWKNKAFAGGLKGAALGNTRACSALSLGHITRFPERAAGYAVCLEEHEAHSKPRSHIPDNEFTSLRRCQCLNEVSSRSFVAPQ
jgi:hypothetical protein